MWGASVKVYLIDDDPQVLRALTRLLGAAGFSVESYSNAEDFLRSHDSEIPGCVVVDLSLPGLDGFGVQQKLSAAGSDRPIIFLTGCGDIPASVRAMKAGAVDFLTKPVAAESLLAAIEIALDRDQQRRQLGDHQKSVEQRVRSLTPREREVMAHVVAGRLNKQIAFELGTVEKTVKVHRARMMGKMHVRTVADLVRLVSPGGH